MKEFEQKEMPVMEQKNLFAADASGYGIFNGVDFVSVYPKDSPMYVFHIRAHSYFRTLVLSPDFPCIAGQGVMKKNKYAFCAYPDMTSPEVAKGVCHDLVKFEHGLPLEKPRSFIAAFKQPEIVDQLHGAEFLYTLLMNMHQSDEKMGYQWDAGFSNDITSSQFAFSIGEKAHFVSLFYPFASSETRMSDFTIVLFNQHAIFQKLRAQGFFGKLKEIIRGRITNLHPHLDDHGSSSEFRQYALVGIEEETQEQEDTIRQNMLGGCPFQVGNR